MTASASAIFSRLAKDWEPVICQFLTGVAPEATSPAVSPQVPCFISMSANPPISRISEIKSLRNCSRASRSATAALPVPRTATALSFLAPITAPTPERAAARPRSLMMPLIRDSFSEAGPMQAIRIFLSPAAVWMAVSVSTVSLPQSWAASFNSILSSFIIRYLGEAATPETKTASQPAAFSSAPKYPPELASPQPPVKGDLQTAM